jgi:hypothetical protein
MQDSVCGEWSDQLWLSVEVVSHVAEGHLGRRVAVMLVMAGYRSFCRNSVGLFVFWREKVYFQIHSWVQQKVMLCQPKCVYVRITIQMPSNLQEKSNEDSDGTWLGTAGDI